MNDKKRTTEEFDQWSAWRQDTYQTGSTRPPKSHVGMIAFLLGLVIFLCGISTALGLMNIRLFRELNDQSGSNSSPVAFSRSADEDAPAFQSPLGFTGQEITHFWNLYQDLPQGIYITDVDSNSDAAAKGISPRDILLSVDGVRITQSAALDELLSAYQAGDTVDVIIYRDGKQLPLKLKLK